jgi:hypothetical protein
VRAVIVVSEPEPGVPRRRRGRRAPAAPAAAVAPVTRVTVIRAEPLKDAGAWLREPELDAAEAALASLLSSYRIAAADFAAPDADPARALVVRAGYGSGEHVAAGTWEQARELPAAQRRRFGRRPDMRPQERLAALLASRDAALACEELTLRARADLEHGRDREAAIQLEAALTTALAELEGWRGVTGIARRLAELAELAGGVAAAAAAARAGRLEEPHVAHVRRARERSGWRRAQLRRHVKPVG